MKKVLLCIMDGVGIRKEEYGNAFKKANKPNFDYLWKEYPHTLLKASEEAVGLPKGQMGNSEVGHMNIGSGRVIFQSLELINKALENGELFNNKNFLDLIEYAKKNNSHVHIMGLFSDGGVHSHINHFIKIYSYIKSLNFDTYAHVITDGRDTKPEEGINYIRSFLENYPNSIATISGRYYAMDRDKRWERTDKYFNTITKGDNYQKDIIYYLEKSYQDNITDEFIEPATINEKGIIRSNDVVIWINFRPDRAIQILSRLENHNIKALSIMHVSDTLNVPYALKLQKVDNTLGEYIASKNIPQLRIAETEKYAHVTYFFDGGMEKEFPLCDKVLIPSPKVATYDLKPEMSAYEVCDKLLDELDKDYYGMVVLNFANCDMVGHTGEMLPTIKAVEVVDECLGKLYSKAKEKDYLMIITADHGNCDYMLDQDGNKVTSHSLSLVPFIVCKKDLLLKEGSLCDIAPTMLELMELEKPSVMSGESLIKK